MAVAELRGAKFYYSYSGIEGVGFYPENDQQLTASRALRDVAAWLQFEDASQYQHALDAEGAAIFNRAPKEEADHDRTTNP